MFVAPAGFGSPGLRLVVPAYARGSRERISSLRSWSTSMSSFCQNVETGAEVSGGPKSTSGSPSSLSRSADSSSSSFGLTGFSSE